MRVEKLLAVLPADCSLQKKVGETEYAIGSIPAGRLREDQRDEPVGGPARRGPRPRLPRPAGLEAHRGDRRRARRSTSWSPSCCCSSSTSRSGPERQPARSARSRRASRPRGALHAGDQLVAVDGKTVAPTRLSQADRRRTSARGTPPTAGCKATTPAQLPSSATASAIRSRSTPVYDPRGRSARGSASPTRRRTARDLAVGRGARPDRRPASGSSPRQTRRAARRA